MKASDLIFKDFWLKLFCLFMAILIWEFIHLHLATTREAEGVRTPPHASTNPPPY